VRRRDVPALCYHVYLGPGVATTAKPPCPALSLGLIHELLRITKNSPKFASRKQRPSSSKKSLICGMRLVPGVCYSDDIYLWGGEEAHRL